MLRKTHDGGCHENQKLTEADVTAESVFMLQRRQILKMLGISATALSSPLRAS
jgi:sulfoxide reductase catalytic subunit YedY